MAQLKLTKKKATPPDFAWEATFISQGYHLVAGIDEVGRGALAGPLVAAAVIISPDRIPSWVSEVRDSKLLTPLQRDKLCILIEKDALATGLGSVSPQIIDLHGIAYATRLAMAQAVESLSPQPQALLVDFFQIPEVALPQRGIVGGDRKCLSIACASILAKVKRDEMMVRFDSAYPGYGFRCNKGYSTSEHLLHLREAGPSPIHRISFAPIKGVLG